ncbi:MAG: toprim domain-containing protein [Paracoccaceae bacterium]
MTDPISAFIAHMRSVGCDPFDASIIVADDRRKRFRLAEDKPKTLNGCYQLKVEADGFAVGWCKNWREGTTHGWSQKAARKLSADERAVWKAKAVLARQERDRLQAEEHAAEAVRAKILWERADKTGAAGYLQRKGCKPHGTRVSHGAVMVPVYGVAGIMSLQMISEDGSKRFLKGSQIEGGYFPIADKGETLERLVICEGFATGAAIRESTGWPVVCAFNAGNLVSVAKAMRGKYPDAKIIIGADSDRWTVINGQPVNPGLNWAMQAAADIGGAPVVAPEVPEDDEARRTDWDDIWRTDGPEAVQAAFEAALIDRTQEGNDSIAPGDDRWEPDYAPPDQVREQRPFRCLGYNRGKYYFLPSCNGGQMVELSGSAVTTMAGICQVHSSHDYWSQAFGDGKMSDRQVATFAGVALMDECHRVGVFRPESVRGSGAWRDADGVVVNDGQAVITPQGSVPVWRWGGDTIYEADVSIYATGAEPMVNGEALKLREICNALQWQNPLHGDLLAGWLVIAPFGSCLRWRPHTWLTGASGAGKSWVIDAIIRPVLGKAGLVYGGVTEAGIRSLIKKSGRPFVLDEAEAENRQQRENMQKVLHLLRAASSGSSIATAYGEFAARSCFMLSSINVSAQHQADENRITQLVLAGDKRPDRGKRFAEMRHLVADTITPDFVARLQARTMANLDTLCANEATFKAAAGEVFGKQRNADQLAPMIAGLYMLTNTGRIDPDKAVAWIKARDWSWHQSGEDDGDAQNFVTHLMTARLRYDAQGIARESSIGRMVEMAERGDHPAHGDIVAGLRGAGLKVEDGKLWIANNSPVIRKLLENSSWTTWHRTLMDYPGADDNGNKVVYFCAGVNSRVRRIPLDGLLREAIAPPVASDEEVPW